MTNEHKAQSITISPPAAHAVGGAILAALAYAQGNPTDARETLDKLALQVILGLVDAEELIDVATMCAMISRGIEVTEESFAAEVERLGMRASEVLEHKSRARASRTN